MPFKNTKLEHPALDRARANRKIEGRYHPITKDKTPSLKDNDIKDLINKYPLRHVNVSKNSETEPEITQVDYSMGIRSVINTLSAQEKTDNKDDDSNKADDVDTLSKPVGSKIIRQCLETLTRNIDRLTHDEKENQKEYMVTLVQNDIRNVELNKMMDLVKEIDFAEGE